MRIYISGAITGTTDYMERFAEAEKELTEQGYSVVNPAKVNSMLPADTTTYEDYMIMSFAMLSTCESIYMLNGWEKSKGANMEREKAIENGIKIIYQGGESNGIDNQ